MRTIGVVTVARSDYGIYLPMLRGIQEDPDLELRLIVSGMHLSREFGSTIDRIEEDGFEISDRIDMLLASDTPEGIAKSIGLGTLGFAQSFSGFRPDILMVLGDRFEMYCAALAALPFKIPVAHIHGGEVTAGAIDDSLRHSMTKLSHLHFVSTETYAGRVIQMGEEPWRVTVSGAPALDNLRTLKLLSRKELEAAFGLDLKQPFLLATFHPTTLEYEQAEAQTSEFLGALAELAEPVLFTATNADTAGRSVAKLIREFVARHSYAQAIENLGIQGYFSAMALASAMVGNSSSGIIEAASFGLPVVNVGNRQRGRLKGENVIDTECRRHSIIAAVKRALAPAFRAGLRGQLNPYGSGTATAKIIAVLKQVKLDDKLVVKAFCDARVN